MCTCRKAILIDTDSLEKPDGKMYVSLVLLGYCQPGETMANFERLENSFRELSST